MPITAARKPDTLSTQDRLSVDSSTAEQPDRAEADPGCRLAFEEALERTNGKFGRMLKKLAEQP